MQRLLFIVVTLMLAAFTWLVFNANPTGQFELRNLAPGVLHWLLLGYVLYRHPRDPRWWLGWLGFSVPAMGLAAYLHLAFLFDWQQLASRAVTPALLFRFLPFYVVFAGGIGFAIGWIVGRGLSKSG